MKHSSSKVAQHIMANGYIPPKIQQALTASKHYLVPGQTPDNPTAPPGRGAASRAGRARGPRELGSLYERDLADLYERDLADLYERDLEDLYERDFDGLHERDIDALIERDLHEFFAREADKVTPDQIVSLANAIQRDPQAKKAVYKALTMDPNVEKVTEQLVADWTTDSDLAKRDAYAEAEAEAEAYYDALEARDAEAEAEAYYDALESRDGEAEGEAEE